VGHWRIRGVLPLHCAHAISARPCAIPPVWDYGVCSLKDLLADWKLLLAMGGAAIAGLALVAYAFFRPAANPEEVERKRRLHLNQIGRIAEGQIVELVEHPPNRKRRARVCSAQAPARFGTCDRAIWSPTVT